MLAAFAALGTTAVAQRQDRAAIAERYTWNVTDLYPSESAWRATRDRVAAQIPELRRFQGRLSLSAPDLADALDLANALAKELSRLNTYATCLADQDTKLGVYQAMKQEAVQLGSTFRSQAAFIDAEILHIDGSNLDRFSASEPRLRRHRRYIDDIRRRAAHTLPDAEQRILAQAGPLANSPLNVYAVLANADFPYPTVHMSDGRSRTITPAAYSELRAAPNRADRETVVSAFLNAYKGLGRTFGTLLNAEVQKARFFANALKYDSTLDMSLDWPNVSVSVYTRLIDGVNHHLPVFHRYLRLRSEVLGISPLRQYDLYAPLVTSVRSTYTPAQAQALVLEAVAPLGDEYVSVANRAFDERWIDWLPSDGKVAGAYTNLGAYDVHPYMLVNFSGTYGDVSAIAHELGHALHSYISTRSQPYPLGSYPAFVAEVASTFNESLLAEHVLTHVKDADERLALRGHQLETLMTTVFRQAQLAEFELRIHEMAQRGQAITGDAADRLYLDVAKKYYGHDQGVFVVDDYVAAEWSTIPHFYRNFYVFQYATSLTAAETLVAKVKSGGPSALEQYLTFLAAGGTKYPLDLLKDAGVDMTSDEPLTITVQKMNRIMDEMEALLKQRPTATKR